MKLTPEQLKQNAAAMIAYAEGKSIQYRPCSGRYDWRDATPNGKHRLAWNCEDYEYRPKPWSLPEPPPGKKWHREDWTEEMLPEGWRPLLSDEMPEREIDKCRHSSSEVWEMVDGFAARSASYWDFWFFRTRRPLPEPRHWSRPEDVPGPVCWMRGKRGSGVNSVERLVTIVQDECVGFSAGGVAYWNDLHEWEHSTDRKTWHPCVKETR
jgi:hypothetical protein